MKLFKLKFLLLGFIFLFQHSIFASPKIENWQTDSGLRVYFVNVPELPMLDLRLTFAAGNVYAGNKPGISSLTVNMLNKGASGLNADQIAEAFESVGAQYSSGSGQDTAWVALRTLTFKEEMQTALDNWLKVIEKPEFPEADFTRLKKQALISLQAEKQDPGSIASKAFYKYLYGEHPYAQPQNGTEESINDMSLDDLKGFYKQYFVNKNGQLALVGSIDRAEANKIANRVSKALQALDRGDGEKAAAIPQVTPLTEAKTVHIPFPSTQAHIMIGQPGNKRGDPDYFKMYLGNHSLGGSGFTSRLMKEIRVKRGLSYSVYSYFLPMKEYGPFLLGLQTKLSQTDEAINVAKDLLKTFQQEGPSEEELQASKLNISGGFPLRTASNDDIMGYIEMIGFYGLPLDYLQTFTKTINAISRDEVIDAFQRRLDTDKLLTVIVGGEAKESEQVKTETITAVQAAVASDKTEEPVTATAKPSETENAASEDEEPECE